MVDEHACTGTNKKKRGQDSGGTYSRIDYGWSDKVGGINHIHF